MCHFFGRIALAECKKVILGRFEWEKLEFSIQIVIFWNTCIEVSIYISLKSSFNVKKKGAKKKYKIAI